MPTAPQSSSSRPRRRLALSPSRAGDFQQCPLLYRLRTIDRIPEEPKDYQIRGTVVHEALEKLYYLPPEERDFDAAVAFLEPALESQCTSPQVAELISSLDREEFLTEAKRLVWRYFRMESPQAFTPHRQELYIDLTLPNEVPVRGFMDRVDIAPTGQVRVVDYKTGKMPSARFQDKALYQMRFYALAYLRMTGVLPAQLKLMYLSVADSIIHSPTESELGRFEQGLGELWQAILAAGATGDFRPKTSKLCDWCQLKEYCPAFGGTPPEYPGWPG